VKFYTVSQKGPTFKLSITLSNLNLFSKYLHCWKVCEIFYKTYHITHLTFFMLLHYLGKLKIQNFCRYSANTEENPNKLHFNHLKRCESFAMLITNEIFKVTENVKILDE